MHGEAVGLVCDSRGAVPEGGLTWLRGTDLRLAAATADLHLGRLGNGAA